MEYGLNNNGDVFMKFGIDLGHECYPDTGSVGVVTEESIIDNVGYKVIQKLRDLGNTVIELRPSSVSSVGNSLWKRYTKSDNYGCDLCVSIHANCGGGHGVEVFTYNAKRDKRAVNILNGIADIGFSNRGIKDGRHLAMVRRPAAVAMLIEICFCDSQNDINIYKNNIEQIANAIVKGLTGKIVGYKIGWNKDINGWWYATDETHYIQNKWEKIDGSWYHFNNGGYCSKGWLCDSSDGAWYYLNPDPNSSKWKECEMITGWMQYKGKWCYLAEQRDEANGLSKGECVINMSYTINGVKYVFDENGYLVE